MTDPTELHLLRGIIAHPHDDTPRLVFADWLDEHAEPPKRCPKCKGLRFRSSAKGRIHNDQPCPTCHGAGVSSDNRHERAEFIRVQCELARELLEPHVSVTPHINSLLRYGYREDMPVIADKWRRFERLQTRERELLTDDRRREWARVPWGKGGKDDAFGPYPLWLDGQRTPGQATPHYRRGFVSRVEVPGLAWVFERVQCPKCGAHEHDDRAENLVYCDHAGLTLGVWRVTPWALAVAAAHPVTEFVMGDREPLEVYPGVWSWSRGYPDAARHALPDPLYVAISPGGQLRIDFHTSKAALDALATAAAEVVREAVLEAWAKEVRT